MITNNRGYALASSLAILPILLSAFIVAYFFMEQLHLELSLKQSCRRDGITAQRRVQPLLTQLLGLNSKAGLLRTQHQLAKQAVLRCLNLPCLPAALKVEQRIHFARQKLDLLQKNLITQSNIILRSSHMNTRRRLFEVFHQNTSLLSAKSQFTASGNDPALAVVPESTDIAPVYRTKRDFLSAQAFALNWQYRRIFASPRFALNKQDIDFESSCSVSLKRESEKWKVVIAEGKSSLKSWSY